MPDLQKHTLSIPWTRALVPGSIAIAILFTAGIARANLDPKEIERDFMAPCCRHSLLADHFSPSALEMKDAIAGYVAEGLTADSIHAIYVAQYGEEILSEPIPTGFNRLSDIGPWAALALGSGVVILVLRSQRNRGRMAERPVHDQPRRQEDDDIERVIREDFDSQS